MEPLISILLPTRKRVAMMEKSFETLLGKARNPELIEICIAYDDDDRESHDYFTGKSWTDLRQKYNISDSVHRLPRWGYKNLHLYLNYLAERSRGQWLFFWGDDALMETDHWDDHVQAQGDWKGLLHIEASNAPMTCSILPLFHRSWIELFGCVTPVNPADSWISDICWRARARRVIPVTVFHDRFEDTGRNQDETYRDKINSVGWNSQYHLPENKQLRDRWTQRLKDHMSGG